jgi:23S rRNA (cytosine1962-C5)-methyltransferase
MVGKRSGVGVFTSEQYKLVDFGQGRKLERFGTYLVDRPCPTAARSRRMGPERWTGVNARFDKLADGSGRWSPPSGLPAAWTIGQGGLVFQLRPTPFGHLGLFPEQAENWDWIAAHLGDGSPGRRMLNLFAYTGGATLAAAAAGAQVTHVDSAKNVVGWARQNAALSGLSHAPIRWIHEDAMVFVQRQLRRGVQYDGLILDPPSYGHGPKNQAWKIDRHLEPLLDACGELLSPEAALVLLTCHTPRLSLADLQQLLTRTCLRRHVGRIEAQPMQITAATGPKLPSGVRIRWTSSQRAPERL